MCAKASRIRATLRVRNTAGTNRPARAGPRYGEGGATRVLSGDPSAFAERPESIRPKRLRIRFDPVRRIASIQACASGAGPMRYDRSGLWARARAEKHKGPSSNVKPGRHPTRRHVRNLQSRGAAADAAPGESAGSIRIAGGNPPLLWVRPGPSRDCCGQQERGGDRGR